MTETQTQSASENVPASSVSWKKRILKLVYFIVLIVLLFPIIALAYLSLTSPKPVIPGVVEGKLPPCPSSPNCVCSFDKDKKHGIEAISFEGDPQDILLQLQEKVGQLPRTIKISSDGNYLHYEFTSLIFRYVDDVEFLLDPEAKLIHVRSASRAGHSDFDANRNRVEQIRALLN